jgi:hypothetical protein
MEEKPKRRCIRPKSDGSPCRKAPIKGSTVCASHGGAAPQVRAAASRRVAEDEIRQGLARLDVEPVGDPFTELSKLAGQVVAWKDALAAKVNDLTQVRYEAMGAGTEQLRAEVALFERALDRCAAVLGLIAKLNIDERMARISDRQATVVIDAVNAALAAAGLSGKSATEARKVAARHLRSAP